MLARIQYQMIKQYMFQVKGKMNYKRLKGMNKQFQKHTRYKSKETQTQSVSKQNANLK